MFRLEVAANSQINVNSTRSRPVDDEVDLEEALARLQGRAEGIRAWLDEHHSADLARNAHLHEGTAERAYWHSGYHCAIADMLGLLRGQRAHKT
ncbi:MAG: hypothetical protein OXF33_03095 [Rhodospirillales bacterium]|nr:hypothetical protein [Rhodospirillales bacterium]